MNLLVVKLTKWFQKLARSRYANNSSKKSTIKTISKNNTDGIKPAIKITNKRFDLFSVDILFKWLNNISGLIITTSSFIAVKKLYATWKEKSSYTI